MSRRYGSGNIHLLIIGVLTVLLTAVASIFVFFRAAYRAFTGIMKMARFHRYHDDRRMCWTCRGPDRPVLGSDCGRRECPFKQEESCQPDDYAQ